MGGGMQEWEQGGEGKARGNEREEEDGWNKRQERSDDGLKEKSNENLPQVQFWEGAEPRYQIHLCSRSCCCHEQQASSHILCIGFHFTFNKGNITPQKKCSFKKQFTTLPSAQVTLLSETVFPLLPGNLMLYITTVYSSTYPLLMSKCQIWFFFFLIKHDRAKKHIFTLVLHQQTRVTVVCVHKHPGICWNLNPEIMGGGG